MFNGCGGRIRTCDLQLMRLASYHCSTPQYIWAVYLEDFAQVLPERK